jgi:hypothetical protein
MPNGTANKVTLAKLTETRAVEHAYFDCAERTALFTESTPGSRCKWVSRGTFVRRPATARWTHPE